MDTEQRVAQHYTRGNLEASLIAALRASGKDPEHLQAEDLSGVDEFHFGWRAATMALARDLGLAAGTRVLDVGAGIGGPARYFAGALGCRVTGIDLTAEFVAVANAVTRRCGLADRASFHHGSALDLPFAAGAFEAATQLHVGMNIADKARLFAEVKRVLRPGGRYAVYDIMQVRPGPLPFPMPWSPGPETSFVEPPETYRRLLQSAGFTLESETDRSAMAQELLVAMRARQATEGPSALGPQLLMGPEFKQRLGNAVASLEAGVIAPVQIIAVA
jgi:ubiquinone/menaquinone biosynthesis C-methylase UbiE